MKSISSILFCLTFLIANSVFAHNGHKHVEINEAKAQKLALLTTKKFTTQDVGFGFGQLEKLWATSTADNTAIHKKGTDYYIVSVRNDNIDDTFYVLISIGGKLKDANFTGEFADLD